MQFCLNNLQIWANYIAAEASVKPEVNGVPTQLFICSPAHTISQKA
jgi:hypothetical protein